MILTDIQERVERSIYETLRQVLVEQGWWPDLKLFQPPYGVPPLAYMDRAEATAKFNEAVQNIVTAKGFAIELFGASGMQSKGEKRTPRIVVLGRRALPGDLGTPPTTYIKNGNIYDMYKLPYTTSLIEVDIIMSSSYVKQDRIMAAITAAALSTRNYLDFYDAQPNSNERFFIKETFARGGVDYDQGTTDKILTYQVSDLYIAPNKLIKSNISPIKEIITELSIQNTKEIILTILKFMISELPELEGSIDNPANYYLAIQEKTQPKASKISLLNLANYLEDLIVKPKVFDGVQMTGNTAETTETYLDYGINVVSGASSINYAARLPYPPIKGRSLTIVNISGYPIVIYPSVDGGSINGVINGSALIPSDGKSYVFTCWENPLPGAWSWTPPATNQYNSGEIIMLASSSTGKVSAVATNVINLQSENDASTGVPFNGKNKALILNLNNSGFYFKPSNPWAEITKIKIYTNTNAPSSYYLKYAYQINYYNPTTGAFVGSGAGGSGDLSTSNINTAVTGAFVPSTGQTYLSDFIGDAGTLYKESLVTSAFGPNSIVGDKYLGQTQYNGNTVDVWYTGYIKFIFIPNGSVGNIAGVKFQFFLEYN